MKIIRHHFHNNELQRSEVEHGEFKFVRLHMKFSRLTGELLPVVDESRWFWDDGGHFVESSSDAQADFERFFVDELIRLNVFPPVAVPLPEPAPAPIQLPAEADDVPF